MAGRAVESGLVEALSSVLARRLSDRNAHIAAVDLAGQVKLGEFRAYVEGVTHTSPDPELLGRVADALADEPEIDSATPVQSKIHFSPSTKLLVDVVARCAGLEAADEAPGDRPGVIVTFCSPNTNKPLHLGHLRASLLAGYGFGPGLPPIMGNSTTAGATRPSFQSSNDSVTLAGSPLLAGST